MEWQPIETAPKDGTRILLFSPDSGCAEVGFYNTGGAQIGPLNIWTTGYVLEDGNLCEIWNPPYWMPIPPMPSHGRTRQNDLPENQGIY